MSSKFSNAVLIKPRPSASKYILNIIILALYWTYTHVLVL